MSVQEGETFLQQVEELETRVNKWNQRFCFERPGWVNMYAYVHVCVLTFSLGVWVVILLCFYLGMGFLLLFWGGGGEGKDSVVVI